VALPQKLGCRSRHTEIEHSRTVCNAAQSQFGQVEQGVCHTVALPFTLKSILRQKKNYENSNISPMQKYTLQKSPLKETKIIQDVTTLVTNLKFQHKPKYHLSEILI